MKKIAAALIITLGLASSSYASTYSDALGKCIMENSSSEDQETMTQWAFVTLGKTAAAKKVQTIPAAQTSAVEKKAKTLMTKLALNTCSKEFAVVVAKEPTTGLQNTAGYIAASLLKDQVVSAGLDLFPSLKSSTVTNLINDDTVQAVGGLLKNMLQK